MYLHRSIHEMVLPSLLIHRVLQPLYHTVAGEQTERSVPYWVKVPDVIPEATPVHISRTLLSTERQRWSCGSLWKKRKGKEVKYQLWKSSHDENLYHEWCILMCAAALIVLFFARPCFSIFHSSSVCQTFQNHLTIHVIVNTDTWVWSSMSLKWISLDIVVLDACRSRSSSL